MPKNAKLVPSSKPIKLPPPIPLWLCKAMWRGTALKLKVEAKDEHIAKDKAWKQVARMMGGDLCMEVQVLQQLR